MADSPISIDLGRGLRLRSPILAASGTFGYGFDAPLVDRAALGAIVTKGTTLRAREGNAPVRIAETPSGMLNSIGLQNPGVDQVVRKFAPQWSAWDLPVIVNVAGTSVDDYVAVVQRLDGVPGIAGIELNISCPNVKAGLQFGVDARLANELTVAVRKATSLHLMVKLTPNVSDIAGIASAIEDGGADSLSAINTYVGMSIDIDQKKALLNTGTGGLSGPAIKPLAVRAVWQVVDAVSLPVIGIGGIFTTEDALEFFMAGATAIQLGTVNYVRPQAAREIHDGLVSYLREKDLQLGGLALRPAKAMARA